MIFNLTSELMTLYKSNHHLKRARKATLRILDPVGRKVVKLKPRRQSHDLRVPISALAHPDLDADDVDAIDATRIFWSDANATNL